MRFVIVMIFIFLALFSGLTIIMSLEGYEVEVPHCPEDNVPDFYARSGDDANTNRILFQLEARGWTDIHKEEGMTDTITALCDLAGGSQ